MSLVISLIKMPAAKELEYRLYVRIPKRLLMADSSQMQGQL